MKKVLTGLFLAFFFMSCSNLTENTQSEKAIVKPMENGTGGSDGGSTGPAPPDPNGGE